MTFICISNFRYVSASNFEEKSIVLISVREVFTNLGYLVQWNDESQTISIICDDNEVVVLKKNDNIVSDIFSFVIINDKAFCTTKTLDELGHTVKKTLEIYPKIDIGDYAPNFRLRNLDEEYIELINNKGNRVILVFWASWCPYCKVQLKAINSLIDNKIIEELDIITVNVDKNLSSNELIEFMNNNNYKFEVLLDRDNRVLHEYNIKTIPSIFIIDNNGVIVEKTSNISDVHTLEEILK